MKTIIFGCKHFRIKVWKCPEPRPRAGNSPSNWAVQNPRPNEYVPPFTDTKSRMCSIFTYFYRPQRSCEGYVFTRVCLSTRVGSTWAGTPHPPGSTHTHTPPPGAHPPGSTPPGRRLTLRTVRILLECILVEFYIHKKGLNICAVFYKLKRPEYLPCLVLKSQYLSYPIRDPWNGRTERRESKD